MSRSVIKEGKKISKLHPYLLVQFQPPHMCMQAASTTGVCRPDGQEESNTEFSMKAAKISPPDTRSSRISIRFNGLGFITGCGARLISVFRGQVQPSSPRRLAPGHGGSPCQPASLPACSSEIWPDGVRDLKRWFSVGNRTFVHLSRRQRYLMWASIVGQRRVWAGPAPLFLFRVKCDRSQRLVTHSRLHSE